MATGSKGRAATSLVSKAVIASRDKAAISLVSRAAIVSRDKAATSLVSRAAIVSKAAIVRVVIVSRVRAATIARAVMDSIVRDTIPMLSIA